MLNLQKFCFSSFLPSDFLPHLQTLNSIHPCPTVKLTWPDLSCELRSVVWWDLLFPNCHDFYSTAIYHQFFLRSLNIVREIIFSDMHTHKIPVKMSIKREIVAALPTVGLVVRDLKEMPCKNFQPTLKICMRDYFFMPKTAKPSVFQKTFSTQWWRNRTRTRTRTRCTRHFWLYS